MTGFGAATREAGGLVFTCEIRSVNHRFLSIRCGLPDGMTGFEPLIERLVRERVQRGSVNVTVGVESASPTSSSPLDVERLKALRSQLEALKKSLGYEEPLAFETLLSLPLVWQNSNSHTIQVPAAWEDLRPVVVRALAQLGRMRQQEGTATRDELLMRIRLVRGVADRISAKAPSVVDHYRQKLRHRLHLVAPAAERTPAHEALLKEILSLVERCDISEEVQRLRHHVGQFEKTLRSAGKVGRRLDFLNQEMLRETNTIASKAAETRVIDDTIAIKAELERIKEQVENVE